MSCKIQESWQQFQSSFTCLNNIQIPRWVGYSLKYNVQFHGFSDASERAYAAALYIRIEYQNEVQVHLISSKTKVAPIKTLSIPRLELCGALLLAEMIDAIIPKLDITSYSVFCWTDSTIVLSWLAKSPGTWSTFVANRISAIIQIIDSDRWFHVASEDNPADLASRGVYPNALVGNVLWWHGPKWLKTSPETWKSLSLSNVDTDIEKKSIKCNTVLIANHDDLLSRFSSLPRALRCISYVYRFFFRTHPKHKQQTVYNSREISSKELNYVRSQLFIITQKVSY